MCVCVSASVSTKNEENLSPKFKMIVTKKEDNLTPKMKTTSSENKDVLTQKLRQPLHVSSGVGWG